MAQEITLDTLLQGSGNEEPKRELVDAKTVQAQVEKLTPEQMARVEEVKNGINLMDSQTMIQYGVGAQRNISNFSDNILNQVRNKDSGYVGDLMSELILKVKDAEVDRLDDGIMSKIPILRNASKTIKKFMQKYERLELQIDRIEQDLEKARMQMLKDITLFDSLYEKNMEYFQDLQIYILAGDEKLKELQQAGKDPFQITTAEGTGHSKRGSHERSGCARL